MKLSILGLSMLMGVFFMSSCGDDDSADKVKVSIKGRAALPAATSSALMAKSFLQQATSASELKLKVYKMGFSTAGDCSNPVVVDFDGEEIDFASTTENALGEVEIPAADYKCVIVEMSDQIKFKPLAAVGSQCVLGTVYTQDVCYFDADFSGTDFAQYKLLDGSDADICGTSVAENKVSMYLSVDAAAKTDVSSATNGLSFYMFPPQSDDPQIATVSGTDYSAFGGFKLSDSFNAGSNSVGVFYMNTTDKVVAQTNDCVIGTPEFGFYKE